MTSHALEIKAFSRAVQLVRLQVEADKHRKASNELRAQLEGRPSRHGRKWSVREHEMFLQFVKKGYPILDIALCLRRTRTALKARLRHQCLALISTGKTISEAAEELGLSLASAQNMVLGRAVHLHCDSCFSSPRSATLPPLEAYAEHTHKFVWIPKPMPPRY